VDAAARERQRVERCRGRDHGDRGGGVIDGEQREHQAARDGERRGRSAPAQHQPRGGREPQGERERPRCRVRTDGDPHRDDGTRQQRHGGIKQT